jgi:DNA-binding response OmpR family regulator
MTPTTTSPAGEPIDVLHLDDDAALAAELARFLGAHGVRATHARRAREGIPAVLRARPDLILLDAALPDLDGVTACRELRAAVDTPIIMTWAGDDEVDRVLGLESGADDCVRKPVAPRELLARVRAHVRRARGRAGPRPNLLSVGRLRIDLAAMCASIDGAPLLLTAYELTLLRALAERAGHVLTREQLIEAAGGAADAVYDRSVDVHISRLRQKLGDGSRNPKLLKTVRSVGYMLAADAG